MKYKYKGIGVKLVICLVFIFFCLIVKSQTVSFNNRLFTNQLDLSNFTIDTLIIDSCTFKDISGFGVKFKNLKFVFIKNSIFQNLSDGAIIGSGTRNTIINNCKFDSIKNTAIQLFHLTDRNKRIEITNNKISNVFNSYPETGKGLRIYSADTVIILNNKISYCESSGISAGRNYGNQIQQKISYLLIKNNDISYTLSDGISAQENVTKAIVSNNKISFIAYDGIGERPLDGDHGIYWQAPDAIIEGNEIYNILDSAVKFKSGVGISIRTSAKILRNKIYQCYGRGIAYFNDHPTGNKPLLIENNIIFDNKFNGVYINGSNSNILNPSQVSKPDSIQVYNNTIVNKPIQNLWHHSCPVAINDIQGNKKVNGNILIYENYPDTAKVLWKSSNIIIEEYLYNVQNNVDIGFIDFLNRNFDLTNIAISAIEKIPESQAFVTNDFYNNQRIGKQDIGAVEFSQITNIFNQIENKCNIITYPNPFFKILKIDIPCQISNIQVILYTIDGKLVINKSFNPNENKLELNLEYLPQGLFILKIIHNTKIIDLKLIMKNGAN